MVYVPTPPTPARSRRNVIMGICTVAAGIWFGNVALESRRTGIPVRSGAGGNGTPLDWWIVLGGSNWKVDDGMITVDGKYGWLATKTDYTDFSLQADFRTSAPNINSGIFLRRGRDEGDSHHMGYELQIRNAAPNDKP